eukprot:1024995-Prymnesium_polylepis.1
MGGSPAASTDGARWSRKRPRARAAASEASTLATKRASGAASFCSSLRAASAAALRERSLP